jgi:hypothetical protein
MGMNLEANNLYQIRWLSGFSLAPPYMRKEVATMEHRKAMVSDTMNALNANRLARIAVPALGRSSATNPPAR